MALNTGQSLSRPLPELQKFAIGAPTLAAPERKKI
jgi:hypothetical protein